jgi:hypothetical protein
LPDETGRAYQHVASDTSIIRFAAPLGHLLSDPNADRGRASKGASQTRCYLVDPSKLIHLPDRRSVILMLRLPSGPLPAADAIQFTKWAVDEVSLPEIRPTRQPVAGVGNA